MHTRKDAMDEYMHGRSEPLCLGYASTISARETSAPSEQLHTYGDLLAWSEVEKVISPAAAAGLAALAAAQPAAADAVLAAAKTLRDAIYRIFTQHADGQAPAAVDLAVLNRALARAMPHRRLVPTGTGFTWQWEEDPGTLDCMLWPIAYSAAELLTGPELDRVRECAEEHCNMLFLDRSKNRSRRWCDMQDCGNVAKVRRYRKRRQEQA